MSEMKYTVKFFVFLSLFLGVYALGYSNGKIKVLENYKIECKVGTSTECFWIKKKEWINLY